MANTDLSKIIFPSNLARVAYAKMQTADGFGLKYEVNEKVLRFEHIIDNNKQSYTIDMLASTGQGDRPLEVKLENDSSFFLMGIAVGFQDSDDLNGQNQSTYNLFHYADTGLIGGVQRGIKAFYNGSLSIKTGTKTVYDELSMSLFNYDPGTDNWTYGPTFEEKGFHFLARNRVLNGSEKNSIHIEVPSRQDLTAVAGEDQMVLVVEFYGFESKGNMTEGAVC